jgi:hypothetical protein
MEKVTGKSQFNKRQPAKKVSEIGRTQRNRLHHRTSLSKTVGKLRKGEEETPIVAIQQVHLLRKQKSFLTKQAFVFEKKAETVKDQVKELERKIKLKKELAVDLVRSLEGEAEPEETETQQVHRAKPDKTISKKSKGFFRLGY